MRQNHRGTLSFEDTADPNFHPESYGITSDPQRVIHGQLADGSIIRGMEVFRVAYREIGLGFLLAPTAWPILKPIFDCAYLIFARNRKRLGKFFGSSCPLPK